jgi:GH18 family chitinase
MGINMNSSPFEWLDTAVCEFLSGGATREFDVYSQVPFAYKNFDWVAYESDVSAALKAQWVVKAAMGGIMTFALNYDDIKGLSLYITNSYEEPINCKYFTFNFVNNNYIHFLSILRFYCFVVFSSNLFVAYFI